MSSEKYQELGAVAKTKTTDTTGRWVKAVCLLALFGLVGWMRRGGGVGSVVGWYGRGDLDLDLDLGTGVEGKESRWNEIIPSSDLIWHRCHNNTFDCARLDVPLDWLDESDLRKATLAVIRLNATDRSDYKGPLFINPGGPGGSGIWFVRHLGAYYQSVVGKNFDIISFDPRGIGLSLPSISCWNSSTSQILWSMTEPPVLDAYPGAVYEAYAHAAAFSQQCSSRVRDVGRHVTTASLARDLLHVNELLGEEKLMYWGFSYGTYVAATFAALFPDKVGKIVSDGNVDAVEFASGVGLGFVADTDAVMEGFYFHCHRAGPEICSMYDASPERIQGRVDTLLADLRIHPVVVPASSPGTFPEIITFSKLRQLIVSCLYRPIVTFPPLDRVLAALEKGDGNPFVSLTATGQELQLCDAENQNPIPEFPEAQGSADGGTAVLCTDAAPLEGGVEAFAKYVEVLEGISKVAGAAMAGMALVCAKWPVEAKWRFAGPFQGNTSYPILFIANTADNVTPLRSAQHNAKGFPGSVILVSDSFGHTSLSTPSRCIAKNIRNYFQTGELPPPDTICAPDILPFEKWNMTDLVSMDAEEIELEVAMRELMIKTVDGLNLDARL